MKALHDFLKDDLKALNSLIGETLKATKVPLITDVAEHLMASGGKRLRPLLTFLCAHLCGDPNPQRLIRLGACIEFIHTATLLHDDVIDQSNQRRGRPTAHTLWGNEASVLVGDFLFSRAFEMMVDDNSSEVFKILSQTASRISEGELLQLMHRRTLMIDESIYMEIIGAKTASLFSAAAEIGPLAANAPCSERHLLKSIGYQMGLLFQISDDMMDFGLSPIDSGKSQGNDVMEGKMTLPLILAYKKANTAQQKFIEDIILDPEKCRSSFSNIQCLLEETGAMRETVTFAEIIQQTALENILKFKETPERHLLQNALSFSLNRHTGF
jgi:octaprenyl-diphosphate synthase